MKSKPIRLIGTLFLAMFAVGLLLAAFWASAAATPVSVNSGWIDNFDSPTLDPRWTWVREDPAFWSLTDHPGFLRITTQEGSIRTNSGRNVLVAWPNTDDFQIETKVTFTPTENVLNASLVVYQDDDNYVQIARYHINGDNIRLRVEIGGQLQSEFSVNETATTVYLRLVKFNNFYIGSYGTDGSNWIEVARVSATLSNPKVSITANGGSSSLAIPADFDYFQLSGFAIRYVAPGGNCGGVTPCYATIQSAVDAASDFDAIKVAAGTYTDVHVRPRNDVTTTGIVTQVVYISKTLAIEGGYTTTNWITPNLTINLTTLDAQGQGRVIYITGDINPTIEGLHITGGYTTDGGGGILAYGAGLSMNHTLITSNTAEDKGGGIAVRNGAWASVTDCKIYSNISVQKEGGGVGVYDSSHMDLIKSWVVANAAPNNDGGGIMVGNNGSIYIENSIIAGNTARDSAGGLQFGDTGPHRIVNSHIVGNYTDGVGGAIGTYVGIYVEMTNTLVISNIGITGIDDKYGNSTAFLLNYCDTYGNSPDGTLGVTISRTNCLGSPPEHGLDPRMAGGALPSGVGPAFASQWLSYDYSLLGNSPAINVGTSIGTPATDIKGTPRDARPDMGAYEYLLRMIYLPLVRK